MARLALLVFVALVGAGLTLGAISKPLSAGVRPEQAAVQPSR